MTHPDVPTPIDIEPSRLQAGICRGAIVRDRTVELFGLISFRLPLEGAWKAVDMDFENGRTGVTLVDTDDSGELSECSVLVVDVTGELTEPDLTTLSRASLPEVDQTLRHEAEHGYPAFGQELLHWCGSSIVARSDGHRLLSSCVVRVGDVDANVSTLRMRVGERLLQIQVSAPMEVDARELLEATTNCSPLRLS